MASCRKNKAENDKIDNNIEKKEDMKAAKKSSTKAELTVSAAAGTVKKGAEQSAETKKAPAKKAAPSKAEAKLAPAPKAEEKKAPAKKPAPAKAEPEPAPKAEEKKAPAKKAAPVKVENKPEPVPAAKAETKKAPAKKVEPKVEAAPEPKVEEKKAPAKKAPAKVESKPEPVPPAKAETKKAPAKKVEPKVEAAPEPKVEEKKAPAKKATPKAEEVHIDETVKEFSVKADEDKPKAAAKKPADKKAKAPQAEEVIPQVSGNATAQGEPNISSPSNVETPAPAPEEIGSIDTVEGKLATYPEETPVEKQPPLGQIKDNLPKGKAVAAEVELIRQPGEVRYSDEDLDEFAEVITQQRTDALDELRMLKDRLDDLTSAEMAEESMIYSMHMAEQGSEAIEKEKTYAQIQRINEYIKKLDDALKRIKDKTYGVCRVCNILIAKERLMAVPITTLSASYKIHSRCPEDGVDRIEPIKVG